MIRVLSAEDVTIVRQGLVALLGYEADLVVVADVERGDEVVPAALRTGPDVAVIDIDLPGPDGLRAAAELRERLPACRTPRRTAAARRTAPGAGGRGARPPREGRAGRGVGGRDPTGGRRGAGRRPGTRRGRAGVRENPLTPREAEVLRPAAQGATVTQIAARLVLSTGTARNHLAAAVAEPGGRSRVGRGPDRRGAGRDQPAVVRPVAGTEAAKEPTAGRRAMPRVPRAIGSGRRVFTAASGRWCPQGC